MKKALIILVLLFVGGAGVTLVLAYTKSPEFTVEREVVIAGAPENVFPYLNDLKKWPEWTVWTQEKYPKMETTYEGAAQGVGAESHWTDPENAGGHIVITKSNPVEGIEYDLFFEGFPKSECGLKMSKVANGVKVTMSMRGSMGNNVLYRVLGLFMSMEDAIAPEFDEGLSNLQNLVENKKG